MMTPLARQIQADFKRNEATCQKALTLLHLLSNKARFRIVCVLARGEFCVHEICEIVGGCNLSNISQQLKMLTLAGIIKKRRDQRRILYSLKDPRIAQLVEFLRQMLEAK
ncbi:MAG: metalloregulator ArsR/SmtB family transcription factor [Verrucomicrobiae bacterium]|nr:metalloregulator ArsR/SmtB family transcription factor [Verrucomicrobiae bacterium]